MNVVVNKLLRIHAAFIRRHEKQMNRFHLRCLRNLLNIRGKTKFLTLKFFGARKSPASSPLCARPKSDGQDKSHAWQTTASPNSCSTGSSAKASAQSAGRERGLRTLSRPLSRTSQLTLMRGSPSPSTVPSGVVSSTTEYDQQRATGSEQPKKRDRRERTERHLHRPTNQPTRATPAGAGSTP